MTHGATVRIGYFDQRGQALDPTSTVEEVVAGQGNRLEHRQVALLERFWFEPATHRAAVATLSGGEQRRLQLLALLSAEPNVLLLDEPTNDLDLDTLRALEDWIEGFEGAVIAVTHDRVFLERVIEHVVAIGDSGLTVIPPGDSVWEHASSQPRRATAAPKGTRAPTQERIDGAAKRRSPSTLRHLLQRAEGDLERAQQARDGLAQELAGEHDHEALAELGIRLAAAEDELAAAEESWLTLASEAESTSS